MNEADIIIELPRLAYIGDLAPDATYQSQSLLFRLFQGYPPERLEVIFSDQIAETLQNPIPGIRYRRFHGAPLPYGSKSRLRNTISLLTPRLRALALLPWARQFRPEAIISLAHGFSCLTAASLAQRMRVPFHLIIHDDWEQYAQVRPQFTKLAHSTFKPIYRQAKSRLCISSYMEQEFANRYGVRGQVLPPLRAADVTDFSAPPIIKNVSERGIVVAFAGTLWPPYVPLVQKISTVLSKFSGCLLMFGNISGEQLQNMGITSSNIVLKQFLPDRELVAALRSEADILFVPMEFRPDDRSNARFGFPSKLALYTAMGLPLLIWAPPYTSAAKWARENPGVAELVESENTVELERAICKLVSNPEYRCELGANALKIGRDFFSNSKIKQKFYSALVDVR